MSMKIETVSDKVLFSATSAGDSQGLQKVLDSGKVHVDCKDEDGTTPLMIASAKGFPKCVSVLLEEGANPCERRNSGTHALFFAAQSGHLEIVVALAQNEPSCVHLQGQDDGTAIFVACQFGHLDIVQYLFEAGASIRGRLKDGADPLFIAAQNGHAHIVDFLLKVGSAVDQTRKDGASALWIASQMGHLETVKLLIRHGADVDAPREDGATPLFKAAHKGHTKIAQELLKHNCSLGLLKNGESVLHAAALFGQTELVKLLLKAGSNPSLKNKAGEIPADLARQMGHFDIADLLSNTRVLT